MNNPFDGLIAGVQAREDARKRGKNSELTDNQRDILRWIKSFIASNGWPPTRKEIAIAFGYKSANAAEDVLKALSRKGAIILGSNGSRKIAINGSYSGRV